MSIDEETIERARELYNDLKALVEWLIESSPDDLRYDEILTHAASAMGMSKQLLEKIDPDF